MKWNPSRIKSHLDTKKTLRMKNDRLKKSKKAIKMNSFSVLEVLESNFVIEAKLLFKQSQQ
jgi:hypothetical protein